MHTKARRFLQVFLPKFRVVTYLVDACPFASVSMLERCPKTLIFLNQVPIHIKILLKQESGQTEGKRTKTSLSRADHTPATCGKGRQLQVARDGHAWTALHSRGLGRFGQWPGSLLFGLVSVGDMCHRSTGALSLQPMLDECRRLPSRAPPPAPSSFFSFFLFSLSDNPQPFSDPLFSDFYIF